MTILEISQIIFNITFSVVAIGISIIIVVVLRQIIMAIRAVQALAENIRHDAAKVHAKVDQFLEGFWILPMVAKFFSKKSK